MVELFTTEEYEQLKAAIARAEKQTSAEIVVAVADVSDDYRIYPLLWGTAIGVLTAGLVALVWPGLSVRFAFAIMIAAILASWLILHIRPLHLWLVPHEAQRRAAIALAHAEFSERVGGRTAALNGLLIFVAFAERYVAIIPDSGIRRLIPDAQWQSAVAAAIEAIRGKQPMEGLVTAINACTAILKAQFPFRADDREELSDSVVIVKD